MSGSYSDMSNVGTIEAVEIAEDGKAVDEVDAADDLYFGEFSEVYGEDFSPSLCTNIMSAGCL